MFRCLIEMHFPWNTICLWLGMNPQMQNPQYRGLTVFSLFSWMVNGACLGVHAHMCVRVHVSQRSPSSKVLVF